MVRSCDSVALQGDLGATNPGNEPYPDWRPDLVRGFLWGKAVGIGDRQAGRRGRKWSNEPGPPPGLMIKTFGVAREWVELFTNPG